MLRSDDQEKIRQYIAADLENASDEQLEDTGDLQHADLVVKYLNNDCEKCSECQQDIKQVSHVVQCYS